MQDQAGHTRSRSFQTQHHTNVPSRKRTRTQFEVDPSSIPNFADKGLISAEQTELFFNAFFQGCDRYVPIFDPLYDSFESINARSTLLANAIVTVGCGVLSEADSQTSNMLNFNLKKMRNLVIINPEYASLETVQALLVMACYSSERSLILAFATRMALDIGLPGAYEELTKSLVARDTSSTAQIYNEEEATLMRRTRAWFQLMVLEQILRVDAGDLRSFQLRGEARRCRILLDRSYSTVLDLRLLSQVELNPLRAKAHDALSACDDLDDEEIVSIVRDAQIDLDIWYNDWEGIMKHSVMTEAPVLLLNLEVQKYWSQAVVACRAVRAIGNDNITEMSAAQRKLLSVAKSALKKHLRVILDQPQNYLSHFRFAMDFVWAKCAFCFLLLLKLTRLLPETDDSSQNLLSDGYALLHELNKAGGGSTTGGGRSHSSRMYLQVLQLSVQKYGKAISGEQSSQSHYQDVNPASAVQDSQSPLDFFWTSSHNGGHEIDAFIPEQFVFEWDFPGLTLFSSSEMGDNLFDDFLASFQGNIESLFYGMPG
ncbi:hypothetical protein LTR10_017725 [Elasticomyces elasticus]|uniref:Xylanolytic transcriptional activator regulatory domain-containing protein n=1 Tax=Exophiala sideris TaxID=1016849 RepID=A0ABR0JC17_9EURO|nr:hypothetical protein LTR10_017725 [Elasticomyces elasticus]KAK5031024.1 hypothetical protein LTS07_004759 [Exophiala sideris]KAK5038746.1 hypothetical protein LTR13_003777 [Exophiala sideris]KAK5060629.1 hypothetical protein LTR69_005228 [Exophiala sideris]KAK5183542.1 hypothetical protein LTR44_003824 [Eurotiomycetes sp. CCFEE 6388]